MTNFYAESILKIYDINDVGKPMIMVGDISEIPQEDIGNSNTIILYEDIANNNYAALN